MSLPFFTAPWASLVVTDFHERLPSFPAPVAASCCGVIWKVRTRVVTALLSTVFVDSNEMRRADPRVSEKPPFVGAAVGANVDSGVVAAGFALASGLARTNAAR